MTAPLAGIRVVDLTWMWAGPHCTEQLAHMGAEVIRIESTDRPCLNRITLPYAGGVEGLNRAGGFNQFNQGKRSLTLDMKAPDGLAIAHELVAMSDVLVENYAVGVAERLGMGWERLSQINPRLVMVSISGYGQTGPYRDRLAFGGPVVMFSGLATLTGYAPGEFRGLGTSYPDPTAAIHGAFAILAALWERRRSGQGQYVDLSLAEPLVNLTAEGVLPFTMRGEQLDPMANHDLQMAPHGVYPCAGEHRWLTLAIRDDAEWQRFAAIVDPALAASAHFSSAALRKQNEEALDAAVRAWTSERDAWEVTRVLQAAGLAAFPVQDMEDLAADEHLEARGYFTRLDHPETGPHQHTGIPWHYSGTPLAITRAAPCLGEANEYVVCELLGRSHAEFKRLEAANVLR